METRKRAALLELTNRSLHADRDNVQSMAEAKEARLKERIGENARLLKRPSISHAFEFPAIHRKQYEEWIITEARVEVARVMGQASFVFETTMEEARAKAHDARLAYGYDPDTPQPDVQDNDEGGFPELEDSAWCHFAYNRGGDEEGDGD